jgi:hypothetical protein
MNTGLANGSVDVAMMRARCSQAHGYRSGFGAVLAVLQCEVFGTAARQPNVQQSPPPAGAER